MSDCRAATTDMLAFWPPVPLGGMTTTDWDTRTQGTIPRPRVAEVRAVGGLAMADAQAVGRYPRIAINPELILYYKRMIASIISNVVGNT